MNEDTLPKKISEWLETQGYPLEMKVARTFQEAGFTISSSEYYLDPEENKPREIDILASLQHMIDGVLFQLIYTVECKSSKKKPWVCFCSEAYSHELSIGFIARHTTVQGRDMLIELSHNPNLTDTRLFHLPDRHAYGVTNAFKDNLDVSYQAIQSAHKAAQALVAYYDREQAAKNRVKTVCVAFPLVIVNAPVFDCWLDKQGTIQLEKVDAETVLMTGFDTKNSVVELVTFSGLSPYIEARAELMAKFLKRLSRRIPNTLQQLEIAAMNAAMTGE